MAALWQAHTADMLLEQSPSLYLFRRTLQSLLNAFHVLSVPEGHPDGVHLVVHTIETVRSTTTHAVC